jgi:hypothetical protein
VTNYLTDPPTSEAYGNAGVEELMVDAWLATSFDVPSDLNWSDFDYLSCGPRSFLLAFEQGKNTEPCVFALKSDPERDLASDDEFGLHPSRRAGSWPSGRSAARTFAGRRPESGAPPRS